ncbi:neutral and basic amino acid transport protein rBAT-like [Cimex lectularius]|uniref:Glycosyl hydrolase family 13 catalytic domain-containing protein n=1 Tax=Cimex lectularius TaxID=79782 RepID=A0A8I6RIU4_CIMLE|nr:neutral and basic amino acid transport protein rBAT-like [Cimex lectularius]
MSTEPGTPNSLYLGIGGASPEFMVVGDEESISNCPLLTPSPTGQFHHPLAINTTPGSYERQLSPSSEDTEISTIPASLANQAEFSDHGTSKPIPSNSKPMLANVGLEESSSSSSCSVMHDSTASAQLLDYLTLATDPSATEKGGLRNSANLLGLGKAAKDYAFVSWNWPIIRRWCFWGVMSLTVACVCIIIGYMATIPTRCDPPRAWHQGSLIYQIFPPSFQDADSDGIGDLKGISSRISYLERLGVRGVRLSYIFQSKNYPEYFDDVQSLTQIDPNIGNFDDFRVLVEMLHNRNISVILDLPIHPYFDKLRIKPHKDVQERETSKHVIVNNHILINSFNKTHLREAERGEITKVLTFWLNNGVDGFYLHGLESFLTDEKFIQQVSEWREELNKYNQNFDKILICSETVLNHLQESEMPNADGKINVVLKSFDLINVKLDPFIDGTKSIKQKLDKVQQGVIYSTPGYPWVYWTCGDMEGQRLASKAMFGNATLAAILTTMTLPGTPGIFYGDEIGLLDIQDPEREISDLQHAHHLGPMHWGERRNIGFNPNHIRPWLPYSHAKLPLASAEIIAAMSSLRDVNPSLYMHGLWKDHQLVPNTAIRYIDNNLATIERTYPRRHSYLLIANLGHEAIKKDLSSFYYGGVIVLDSTGKKDTYMTFQDIRLTPGEVKLAKLDK